MKYFYVCLFLLGTNLYSLETCNNLDAFTFFKKIRDGGPLKEELEQRSLTSISAIELSKQKPNPNLQLRYLRGANDSFSSDTVEITALHTIELGAKRLKRIQKSTIDSDLTIKSAKLKNSLEFVQKLKEFQRAGQLIMLSEMLEEHVETLSRLLRKIRKRQGIIPSDKVAISTLKLALSEHKAELNTAQGELARLKVQISYFAQCNLSSLRYTLLNFSSLRHNEIKSAKSAIELEKLKIQSAQANVEVQKSLSSSNLTIGPQVEYQRGGNSNSYSVGLVASLGIPLFHKNEGGQHLANQQLTSQKLGSENRIKYFEMKTKALVEKYQRSIALLSEMPSFSSLQKKHHQAEKYFLRGVISMDATINSHQQIVHYLKSKFQTELDILSSVAELVALTGDESLINKLIFNQGNI